MTRDVARTRKLLLDAARAEFAEYGVAGARVDRIAANAGVNKQRIYGHFGNKEELFGVVLTQAMTELAEKVRPGTGSVGEYVGRVFDYHREDPTLLRLLMHEALSYRDGLVEQNPARSKWYTGACEALEESSGCSAEEAGHLLLTLIGLGAWASAMPQLTRLALGPDAQGDRVQGELRDFVVAFAERGAGAGPGAGR
ncbi:TetR/AcrR family transcriptional regulator [Streptomyces sp. NPDC048258]|uniref:TetR/AcrR family transcriptional regulator n=1 Tax=Streptomyces sp. NPDC048258 TaxID=3365527 RepID=UPI0037132A5D